MRVVLSYPHDTKHPARAGCFFQRKLKKSLTPNGRRAARPALECKRNKNKKKLILRVDISDGCDILFPVMRDNITCEEVFEADANARAEFEVVCEEERQAAIEAQDAEMVAKEEEELCWCKFFESCPSCFGKK